MKIEAQSDSDENTKLNPAIPSLGICSQNETQDRNLLVKKQALEGRQKRKGLTKSQIFKMIKFKQKQEKKIKKKQRDLRKKKKSRWMIKYGSNKHLRFFFLSAFAAVIVYYAILIASRFATNYAISIQQDQRSIKCLDIQIYTPFLGSEINCFELQKHEIFQKWKNNIEKQYRSQEFSLTSFKKNNYLKKVNSQNFNLTHSINLNNKYFSNTSLLILLQQQSHQASSLAQPSVNLLRLKDSQLDLTQRMSPFTQLPPSISFCILTYISHQFQKIDYAQYFASLKNQNMPNIKIILIFQRQMLRQMDYIFDLVRGSFEELQHQIIFVQNQLKLGKIGSEFIHSKMCGSEDIVLYVGIEHIFMGSYSLITLRQTFANPSVWLAYSNYIEGTMTPKLMQTGYINQSSLIRTKLQKKTAPNLFAHRKGLVSSIPLQLLTQYFKVQNKQNKYYPRFALDQSNNLLFYTMVQECGSPHVKYIEDYLFIEKQRENKQECFQQYKKMNKYKSLVKKPLKAKKKIEDRSQVLENTQLSVELIQQLKICFKMYIQCKDQFRRKKRNKQ